MKLLGNALMLIGVLAILISCGIYFSHAKAEKVSLEEAKQRIGRSDQIESTDEGYPAEEATKLINFEVNKGEAFAVLNVPKLNKELPIVEGTDPSELRKGVGHLSNSLMPGQGDQILLSGHRDTVFKEFAKLEIGDTFEVRMPYGDHNYEIRHTEIVDDDDTTVIRKMGEEVLVVTTCYPFDYLGSAPERFVFYAYPVK